ncbi:spore protein YabP [Clostridium acetireducens DSM 10703]|jgi:sporulation protein YabP|uniref:Spore protein YabP n=1 Tax=Clostridium acetireducens DSM 10703 TaxID=1121290 RepID=A0A1E8F0C0_9CLOT|nr:sporulation protein YabP [Clostridium acetireducens]OFI06569.1 spore protein YabP [Clostridium acetireducens DSM 10703]
MEKKEAKIENKKSNLNLQDRKRLSISGVIEVISFNEEQIVLNTNLGSLVIMGEDLKMNKLDVQNGDVMISGMINSCVYTSVDSKKERESILSKLFK